MTELSSELARYHERVELTLDRAMPEADGPAATVARAMRYAVFGGGKRLRPILALATHDACGAAGDGFVESAAALELIHTYSLIHDDLPAMDDDDLRRGRPTTHRAFGEAVAVLAGDALLTLAFEWLAERPPGADAERRAAAVALLARRAGLAGMVGGQLADLEAEGRVVDSAQLEWIHAHKTGALFAAAAELGALHAGRDSAGRCALARYGLKLGHAFQIADDLLDRSATAEELGKTPGKDDRAGKSTYPALHGVEASRRLARSAVDEALTAIDDAGVSTPFLRGLARHAIERRR